MVHCIAHADLEFVSVWDCKFENFIFKIITVVPIEAFRKMLTNSFPNLKEHRKIHQQFDKFLKKFLTSCFIDQSDCSKIKYKI